MTDFGDLTFQFTAVPPDNEKGVSVYFELLLQGQGEVDRKISFSLPVTEAQKLHQKLTETINQALEHVN